MIELNPYRKNKVNLADYDFERDVKNRVLLSTFTKLDLDVLEEILFNSIRFPISDIARNLEIRTDELTPILEKLSASELFTIENNELIVDKEMRRYFDVQFLRFDEDFSPGMDFLQQLLKNVAIHVLPTWYHIPRTSNNIFDSLIEKYLQTPQIFQRHLMEINFDAPVLSDIVDELFKTNSLTLPLKYIQLKYKLDDAALQEYILLLEYNFIASLKYESEENVLEGTITVFKEWKDYLLFMRESKPGSIENEVDVFRECEYAFSTDMMNLLTTTKLKPISVYYDKDHDGYLPDIENLRIIADTLQGFDISHQKEQLVTYTFSLIKKLCNLNLAMIKENYLVMTDSAIDWMTLPSEKRALHTYKHPLNKVAFSFNTEEFSDKNIRSIEKSIQRVVDHNWVYLDEFMKGMIVPLNERTETKLRKTGRNWKYSLPDYSERELRFIESTIMDWLFESGIIMTGRHQGRPCFKVTNLGKTLFAE